MADHASKGMGLRYALTLLWRATLLRCPRCGLGKLFRRRYLMYHHCSHCGWVFEREVGYWTGAMAVNLVVAEALITAIVFPLAIMRAPLIPLLVFGLPLPILLPLLFYWHSKAYWMAIDFMLNPVPLE